LLSDWAKAITGEIVHIDGGFHAMGAPTADRGLQIADCRDKTESANGERSTVNEVNT
jgi:hypothetical protein